MYAEVGRWGGCQDDLQGWRGGCCQNDSKPELGCTAYHNGRHLFLPLPTMSYIVVTSSLNSLNV